MGHPPRPRTRKGDVRHASGPNRRITMQAVSLAPQVSDVSFVPTRKRQSAMFKTARFKVHNPSRHKATLLLYALTHYHKTLKSVLETVLSTPDLREQISIPDRKGCSRVNKSASGHFVRLKTPKNWELAPLRDYLIGDATAMRSEEHTSELQSLRHLVCRLLF